MWGCALLNSQHEKPGHEQWDVHVIDHVSERYVHASHRGQHKVVGKFPTGIPNLQPVRGQIDFQNWLIVWSH